METPTLSQAIKDTIEARLTGLHTMLPGKVVKVDIVSGKCDVQPLLKRVGADGVPIALPVITNCPIGFYRAGKAAVYLPLAVGHLVEIRFCERSIDIWLTKGGTVDPLDARKHNLSDAVVYPGLYDFTNPPTDADQANLIVVNDKMKMTLEPSGKLTLANDAGTIEMSETGKFKIQGATDETFAVLIQLLDILIQATTLDPLTGPQPSFIVTDITQLNLVKTKLQGLKI